MDLEDHGEIGMDGPSRNSPENSKSTTNFKKPEILGQDDDEVEFSQGPPLQMVMSYSHYIECQKNFAAALGVRQVDGCGEFIAAGEVGTEEALKCGACGCHRNFHRKETTHHHFKNDLNAVLNCGGAGVVLKRRSRTMFTTLQKEKMKEMAARLGWRLKGQDEGTMLMVEQFCYDYGLTRQVFKVWMHNNKKFLANNP